jgi:anti-anti-sigma factor
MSVRVTRGANVAVVMLVGDHDLATSHEVRRALAGLRTAPLVVVDLKECTFIDSTVLGVLATASRRLAEAGGRLIGVNPSGIVAKALAITGVDELLQTNTDHPIEPATMVMGS